MGSNDEAGKAKKIAVLGPNYCDIESISVRRALDELLGIYGGMERVVLRADDGSWLKDRYDIPYSVLFPAMLLAGAIMVGSHAPSHDDLASSYVNIYIGDLDSEEKFVARLRMQRPFGAGVIREVPRG